MRVLLAAGSGVIGSGVIPGLLERGHHIRLVSHRATADAAEWPEGVEAYQADIADYHSLLGAAEDRDSTKAKASSGHAGGAGLSATSFTTATCLRTGPSANSGSIAPPTNSAFPCR
ncbi:MAG TPA: hypothetical protein VK966_01220, partial [Longimicrobiales bacterium]|nr:hypothetical protein [Longimicrobiales bacterium]